MPSRAKVTYQQRLSKNTPIEGIEALPLQSILDVMSKGTSMYKVRSGNSFYRRRYLINVQNMKLTYTPSRQPNNCQRIDKPVDIYDIHEVRKGWNTDIFNQFQAKFRRHLQATINPGLRSIMYEDNCFSVIIGPLHENLDLIAPNAATRDAWVRGLNHLVAIGKNARREQEHARWIKEQFSAADVNDNGSLNFKECLSLLNQINVSISNEHAKKLFDAANFKKRKIDGEDVLEPDEFLHFYNSLQSRPALENLMKRYSGTNTLVLGKEELLEFLQKEQKMSDITIEDCDAIIEKFESEHLKVPGYMCFSGYQNMLLDDDHDIFNKSHARVYQDMTQPLSHYFIASSHNTYLLQDQLMGKSSVEGYIMALQDGCRCVELDCWDGPGPFNEPIIYHGYTFTSKILFRDVLDAIKQYAFKASEYPVILSLENHCSEAQQDRMAFHLLNILGEYLYIAPVDSKETELPSPKALMRKILVKAKKKIRDPTKSDPTMCSSQGVPSDTVHNTQILKEQYLLGKITDKKENGEMKIETSTKITLEKNKETCKEKSSHVVSNYTSNSISLHKESETLKIEKSITETDSSVKESLSKKPETKEDSKKEKTELNGSIENTDKSEDKSTGIPNENPKIPTEIPNENPAHDPATPYPSSVPHHGISAKLSDLVTYCRATHFSSFDEVFENWKFYYMTSFEETKAEYFSAQNEKEFIKFNARHLSRTYPKGLRTDSSNYNPVPFWNSGCQMVALNYQTFDFPMLLNTARFAQNGRCGYVLKPEFQRHFEDEKLHLHLKQRFKNKKRLLIKVISGQHIPKPGQATEGEVVDPYVTIEVCGHPSDLQKVRTKYINDNGFNPEWHEDFELKINVPELAIILFKVKDKNTHGRDLTLGRFSICFTSMLEGYRHVRLLDEDGEPIITATLFVHIAIKD